MKSVLRKGGYSKTIVFEVQKQGHGFHDERQKTTWGKVQFSTYFLLPVRPKLVLEGMGVTGKRVLLPEVSHVAIFPHSAVHLYS